MTRGNAIALAVCAVVAGCRGCSKDTDEEEAPAIAPLYPTEGVKPEPLAVRFCNAVHALPVARRAECCSTVAGVHFARQCTSALSKSLQDGIIELVESEVAACEAAMQKEHEGCDWIGPVGTLVAPECSRVVHGKLAAGTACKSSLECATGLRCAGSGVNDPGKCAPAGVDGAFCNVALDALATYARQDDFEVDHPQCTGYCERRRCMTPRAIGAECRINVECGRGNRCSDGKCATGAFAAAGSSCLGGDCATGLRCYKRVCSTPKLIGEACSDPLECKSDCISGKCEKGCGQLPPILRRAGTATASK